MAIRVCFFTKWFPCKRLPVNSWCSFLTPVLCNAKVSKCFRVTDITITKYELLFAPLCTDATYCCIKFRNHVIWSFIKEEINAHKLKNAMLLTIWKGEKYPQANDCELESSLPPKHLEKAVQTQEGMYGHLRQIKQPTLNWKEQERANLFVYR